MGKYFGKGERISVLCQNHNAFDEFSVMETVLQGDQTLYQIMKEKEAIYSKPDFSIEDGIRAGELEALFEEKNGRTGKTKTIPHPGTFAGAAGI